MTAQDLPAAAALSREVGWPHQLDDWQFVHAAGHGLVAWSGDQLIGTAMWWSYGREVARVGMVIVKPTIQRAGIGRALMRAILDRVGETTLLLNATTQGETLYRQLGFREIGSIVQHQGVPVSRRDAPSPERIRPLRNEDLARVVEIDAAANGASRKNVVADWLNHGNTVVLDDAGELSAFACCRRFGRGHLIGPVIARDMTGARLMIAHFVDANVGNFVRIDVPGDCGLSDWLETLGLARVDIVATMVRGTQRQDAGLFRKFGLVNQALG